MVKHVERKLHLVIVGIAVLLFAITGITEKLQSESVTMAPFKIVLNAQGIDQDVQANISMVLASGYMLDEYEVNLSFDGIQVSQAFDFRYCYIDDIFIASFDRADLQENPVVIGMANTVVTATVDGWFTAVNSDGESYKREFSGTDTVEIVKPGKKK